MREPRRRYSEQEPAALLHRRGSTVEVSAPNIDRRLLGVGGRTDERDSLVRDVVDAYV